MASAQDITDEARADLKDTGVAPRWSDVDMLRHVNAAIRRIVEIVPESSVVEEQISISDGESRQTLPAGGVKFIRAWNVDLQAEQNALLVAVSDAGGTANVLTSVDGVVWLNTAVTPGTDQFNWVTVAFSPQLQIFVAGAPDNDEFSIMSSPDGFVWTGRDPTGGIGNRHMQMHQIIWIDELLLFVGVGTSTQGGNQDANWSTDGINWTLSPVASLTRFRTVAYSPTLNLLVAIDDNLASFYNIFTSSDGKVWVDSGFNVGASVGTSQPVGMIWSESLQLFICMLTSNGIMTSPDGTTWTARSIDNGINKSVAYSPTLNLLAAVGSGSGSNFVATSPDGTTWTTRSAPDEQAMTWIIWDPLLLLFVATSDVLTDKIWTSSNGIDWTVQTTGTIETWQAITAAALNTPRRGTSMTHVELDAMDSAFPEWTFVSAHAANLDYPAPPGFSQCDHFAHDPREPRIYHVFPASASTFAIFLTYAKMPTALTLLADTFPLGDEYFDAAVALVKHRMLEKDGRHGQGSDRREDAYNDFLRALGAKVNVETTVDPAQHRPPEDLHG